MSPSLNTDRPPDRLDAVLREFSLQARLFHTGALCGSHEFDAADVGYLHLLRSGSVEVQHGAGKAILVNQPGLLFYPRPLSHRFVCNDAEGAWLSCASVRFAGGRQHPLANALPEFLWLPLHTSGPLRTTVDLLFTEAAQQACGRRAILDRLFEVVLIQLLRYLLETGQVTDGLLAGLSHPRLRHALIQMHERPQLPWSLAQLAQVSGMSRSLFARNFRARIGLTPGEYLADWRIALGKKMLLQGKHLEQIAVQLGYGSAMAFNRMFRNRTGTSPSQWRRAQSEADV